jgi:hypothetical protein
MAMWGPLALMLQFYSFKRTAPGERLMRLVILTSLMLCALTAATGCASQNTHAASPDSNDPSWTPPGSPVLTINTPSHESAPSRTSAMAAPQPNKREIRTNQLRAATQETRRTQFSMH